MTGRAVSYVAQNPNLAGDHHFDNLYFAFDLGIRAHASRDTHTTDCTLRIATADARIASPFNWSCPMSRIAFSSRFFFVPILVLTLSACGPMIGDTFSSIGNSLPGDAEPTQDRPAEELPPAGNAGNAGTIVPTLQPVIAPTAQPAIPERRRLTLEFPPQIRAGDSDRVRLTLEVDDLGNLTPTAEFAGNVVKGEVIEIPNLYESHQVIAEARFDIAPLACP